MSKSQNEVKLYAVETRANYEGAVDLWVFTSLEDAEVKFNEVAAWTFNKEPGRVGDDVRLLGPLAIGQNVLDFETGPVVRESQIGR
jgi:hypothetical protein